MESEVLSPGEKAPRFSLTVIAPIACFLNGVGYRLSKTHKEEAEVYFNVTDIVASLDVEGEKKVCQTGTGQSYSSLL